MRASGSRLRCARLPVPRQQFVNALGGVVREAGQDVGKPSLWIVELGGGDEAVDGSRTPAALIGAGEGPVSSSDSNGPQLAFGGVVRHAQAPVVEEAGEGSG